MISNEDYVAFDEDETNLTNLDIDGELFIGQTKEKEETALTEYNEAKEKNENTILISQVDANIPNVFEIKTNIDSKSCIILNIHIEQLYKNNLNSIN